MRKLIGICAGVCIWYTHASHLCHERIAYVGFSVWLGKRLWVDRVGAIASICRFFETSTPAGPPPGRDWGIPVLEMFAWAKGGHYSSVDIILLCFDEKNVVKFWIYIICIGRR